MVKVTRDDAPSVPAEAAAPAMPAVPPGILRVTLVPGAYPYDGVNVAVAPETCQLPAIFGVSVGNGVPGESAEENVSVIGAPPLAWRVPPAGDTDSSRSGSGRRRRLGDRLAVTCLPSPALTSLTWPDAWAEVAANALPATMTAAAAPAVTEIIRCRNSVALTRPTPPALPNNDTARSPQRLLRSR